MQLEKPVWDRLAVPTERKLEGVVDPLFRFLGRFIGSEVGRHFVDELLELQLSLSCRQSGSPLDILLGIADKRRDWREEQKSLGKPCKKGGVVASRR